MPEEPRHGRHGRRGGFTIIELMTVLGLIVLLTGVVATGAGVARSMSRGTACRANLRQLHLAAEAYHFSSNAYPAAILYLVEDGGVRTVSWDFDHRSDGTIEPGPIWAYLDGPEKVFQCPEFRGASTFGDDPATGYNYNTTYIGAEGRFPIPDGNGIRQGWDNCRRGIPPGIHRRHSTTALFGDGGWRDGANKFMRAPSNEVEIDLALVHGGTQAFRHGGCTNICCLDGHVECRENAFEGIHADDGLLESITGFPKNGFLSDEDDFYDPR
ncbi:MAG: hypothetical protein GY895_11850 [Phycisphaera sp.]|nr:hypothetical protein [Phycisphaera sp.]